LRITGKKEMNIVKTAKSFVIDSPFEPLARWIHYKVTGNKDYAYNRETMMVMRRILKPQSNFLDVGCNRGDILAVACKLSPKGRHLGIEPIPRLYNELKFRFKDRATIINAALSDTDGSASFNVLPETGRSGFKLMTSDVGAQTEEIVVPTARLDEITQGENYSMIKVDVNGAEYAVFKGAEVTISRWRPIVVFEHGLGGADQYGQTPEQMFDLFTAYGMKLSTMGLWLKETNALSRLQFCDRFYQGLDFQFIAF
jgi:FkbM family methyltransferase